jgi:hypothetical protein
MPAAPLGKAYIEVRADLAAFPAELRAKLLAAFKEATAGLDFPELEERVKEDGAKAGETLANEFEKKAKPKLEDSGKSTGKSFVSGFLGSVLPALTASFLPVLIGLGIEIGAALLPAVYALSAAIPLAITSAVAAAGALALAFHGVSAAIGAAFSGNPAKMAAAMAKLAPAARDFVKEIAAAQPQLHAFQQAVQQAFFVQLEGSIKRLIGNLLPTLRAGLTGIASDLGKMGAGLASALGGSKGNLATIFMATRGALQPLIPLLGLMAAAFLRVAAIAGPFVIALSKGLADAGTKLATFVNSAGGGARIAQLFSEGLIVLHQFGQVLGSVLSLVGTLLNALAAAGGPALGLFGAIVNELNAFFKSAAGNQALVIIFELLNTLLSALAQILQPLLPVLGLLISALGQQLINAVVILTPAIVQLVNALIPLLPRLIPLLPVITQFAVGLAGIVTFLAQYPGLLQAAAVAFGAYRLAVLAADAAQAIFIAEEAATPWGLVILAIAAIVIGIGLLITHWKEVEHAATSAWDSIKNAGLAVWNWLFGAAAAVRDWFGQVGAWFMALPGQILGFIQSIPTMIVNVFRDAINGIFFVLGFGFALVVGAFLKLPGDILNAVSSLNGMITGFFVSVWDSVTSTALNWFGQFGGFMSALPGRVIGWLWSLRTVLPNLMRDAWHMAYNMVVNEGQAILNFAGSLPGRLGNFFSNVGHVILGGLKDGINGVIRAFNAGIDKAAGPLHILIPHIPQLAKGGIIDQPTLAVLGEGKGREVVLPLSDPRRAQELAVQSGLLNMLSVPQGTPNISITAYFGPNGDMLDVIDQRVEMGADAQATALNHGARSN